MSKCERTPIKPVFVGLDMSLSSTGFSLKEGSSITIDTIKTNPRTCVNDLVRLRYIANECLSRIPKNTKMICIEDYFVPSNKGQIGSAMKLTALGTVMRLALLEEGFSFYVVSPSQLKKFATGKGVCQKSIVVREVFKKWGVDCKDDNQADATVLAHMAEAIFCNLKSETASFEMPKYQIEMTEKVVKERPNYNVEV